MSLHKLQLRQQVSDARLPASCQKESPFLSVLAGLREIQMKRPSHRKWGKGEQSGIMFCLSLLLNS